MSIDHIIRFKLDASVSREQIKLLFLGVRTCQSMPKHLLQTSFLLNLVLEIQARQNAPLHCVLFKKVNSAIAGI